MLEHLMMDGVAGVFGPYRQQCNSRSSWFKSRMEDWGRAFLDHMREIKPPDNPLSQWNFGLLRALGDKAGPRLKNDSWPQVLGEYGDLL
jgi:hypothetical protein